MATKTPEEKAAATALKELQKKAKKLKIDFAGLPVEELQILVNAAEAAQVAQTEKSGEVSTPISGAVGAAVSPRDDVRDAQAKADAEIAAQTPVVTPAGDTVIDSVVTKANKVKHVLVQTPKGAVQLKSVHGVVLANFETVDEGKKHLENLSRF